MNFWTINKILNSFVFAVLFLCIQNTAMAQSNGVPLYTFPKIGNKPLVVYLTGDGGMNSFSKSLISNLNAQGYAVVSLDTRKYFWDEKTPAEFNKTASAFINQYLKAWNKTSFLLVGYSFGADVASFLPPQFSSTLSSQLKSVVLLSPGLSTGFVTKLSNMLGFSGSNGEKYKVYPQLLKSPAPVLCVFGKDEEGDFYSQLKVAGKIRKMTVPGSHRYDDNVNLIAKIIVESL
jgi:type IV secretory pathway VirJ component